MLLLKNFLAQCFCRLENFEKASEIATDVMRDIEEYFGHIESNLSIDSMMIITQFEYGKLKGLFQDPSEFLTKEEKDLIALKNSLEPNHPKMPEILKQLSASQLKMQKQLGFLLQKFVIQINSLAKLVEQTLSDKSEKLAEVFAMQSWVEM